MRKGRTGMQPEEFRKFWMPSSFRASLSQSRCIVLSRGRTSGICTVFAQDAYKKRTDPTRMVEVRALYFCCFSNVKIDYGASSVYSKEDMDSAIEVIKQKFRTFDGCELYSLSYIPDEECNNLQSLRWMNELRKDDNKEVFTQCIAFYSSFRSPIKGGGA